LIWSIVLVAPDPLFTVNSHVQYKPVFQVEQIVPVFTATRLSQTLVCHPVLPSLLPEAGYETALVGKWRLGDPPHFGPLRSGCDRFFGMFGGEAGDQGCVTDVLTRRAIEFVRQPCKQPFFRTCATRRRTGPGRHAGTRPSRPAWAAPCCTTTVVRWRRTGRWSGTWTRLAQQLAAMRERFDLREDQMPGIPAQAHVGRTASAAEMVRSTGGA